MRAGRPNEQRRLRTLRQWTGRSFSRIGRLWVGRLRVGRLRIGNDGRRAWNQWRGPGTPRSWNRRWTFLSFCFSGIIRPQSDAEGFDGAQDEPNLGSGLALFDLNDPLPADSDLGGEGLLVKAELRAAVADDRA